MIGNRIKRQVTMLATALVASMAFSQQPFDLDETFGTAIYSSYVSSLKVLPGGDLLLSGRMNFTPDPLDSNQFCVRLNANGNQALGFPFAAPGGWKLTEWNDRYYVGVGQEVMRIFQDGSVDQVFGAMYECPLFSSLQAGDYHVFPDGRVLFTGTFLLDDTAHDFVGPYRLAWFSNTGYLDTTRVHRQANGSILAVAEDAQGRFLLSGFVNWYDGQLVGRIFRALPDGAPDPSFNAPLEPFGYSYKIQELPDGRILGVGRYKITGQTDTLGVVRLMPDGSLDPSFTPPLISYQDGQPGASTTVMDAHILADGRMIIGGQFDHLNGIERRAIAMLNSDGSVSNEYFSGSGCGFFDFEPLGPGGPVYPQLWVAGIVPTTNGEYYIHGSYTGYDDGTTNYPQQGFVSRLHGLNVGVREQELVPLQLQPNPTYGPLTVQLPANAHAQHAEVLDANGRVVWSKALGASTEQVQLDLAALSEGAYVLRLRLQDGVVRNGRFVILR